jgi:transmembrane sensor
MDNQEAKALLEKYRNGTCTETELAILESWLHTFELDGLKKLNQQDWATIEMTTAPVIADGRFARATVRLFPRIAVAAAAVAAITLGVWFYYASSINGRHPEFSSGSPLANDIAPGRNTATITLANGKTITLSDAKVGVVIGDNKLAYNDGSKIDDSSLRGIEAISSTLTASTPRGGTYQITLPDGTKAWLNAASSIKFPSSFAGAKQRRIEMTGEVYLEVTKDKKHPFIVESKGQEVEVLGTHFNINSYADEGSTKTTLLEGSVRVSSLLSSRAMAKDLGPTGLGTTALLGPSKLGMTGSLGEAAILKPGQQSIISGSKRIAVANVDANDAVDWKNEEFVFKRETLQSIMRKVSRWYDVEVVYDKGIDVTETFSGVVSRKKNISEVLQLMGLNGQLKFKIENKKVYIRM